MPSHIEHPETQLAQRCHSFQKSSGLLYFFNVFHRDQFSSFIMFGEEFQSFLFIAPILQNLAWQFHKIPINTCSRKTGVVGVCKHSMERVAEFVEKCCHFIKSE